MLFGQGVKGQGYVPLLDTTKQWNIEITGNFVLDTYLYRVSDKDTVINSKKYIIIEKFSSYHGGFVPIEFMREDTITKQVFMKNYYHTPDEYLLYDFSFDVGDSIVYNYQGINKFFVVSTDSITLQNNKKRKVWHLEWDHNPPLCWENKEDTWIEGIGSINGLFYPGCNFGTTYKLLCYFENEQIAYSQLPGDTVCFASNVNIDESIITKIRVFPNPTEGVVFIECHDNCFYDEIFIHNIYQQLVFYSSSMTSSINLTDLPKGVYLLHFVKDGANMKTVKIVRI